MEHIKPRILLAEDDTNLGFVIRDNLEHREFDVSLYENGQEALTAFKASKFDLCILDVMLPVMDGFTLAKQIRELDDQIPLLFLTAKSMKEDRIAGFNVGADDYITKPFSIEELFLRIKVFLKRTGKSTEEVTGMIKIGSCMFDYKNLDLLHRDQNKKLTTREAMVLKLLCDHAEITVKREDILNTVWGNDDYFTGRSMDVFISKLRKYLSVDKSIEIINYHGVGFRLTVNREMRIAE
jgi:DNA-binding response OmpR family regulator